MKTFDKWFEEFWKEQRSGQTQKVSEEALKNIKQAFKEIAQKAWDAGFTAGRAKYEG